MPDPAAPALSPYAKPGPYFTTLAPAEEPQFQSWRDKNKSIPVVGNWQDTPTSDYDMRGYWKGTQGKIDTSKIGSDNAVHLTDEYKTPYHRTFSNESRYANPDAPHWEEDRLIDKTGKLLADETKKPAPKPYRAQPARKPAPAAAPSTRRLYGQ